MKRHAGWLILVAVLLVCVSALADVEVNEFSFPDEAFRDFITDSYLEEDEKILTDEDLEEITEMDCSGKEIYTLKGIEFFTSLESLDCSGNSLYSLDLSGLSQLTELDCSDNALYMLSPNQAQELTVLKCQGNEIDWMDLSGSDALKKLVGGTKAKTVGDHLEYISDEAELYVDKDVYLAVTQEVRINEQNFPDPIFREMVSEYDKDKSGSLKKSEIKAVTSLNCPKTEITSLKGVEYLTALTQLNCAGNTLRELNLSGNKALTTVDCSGNEIEELNTTGLTKLKTLDCSENNLLALQLQNSGKLTALDCRKNNLTSLNLTRNKALKTLDCGENALITLSLTTNTALETLKCDHNKLTLLGVTANPKLSQLWCQHNNLTELTLNKNKSLLTLMVDHNPMASLSIVQATALAELAKNQKAKKDAERQCIFYFQAGSESAPGDRTLYCDERLVLITGDGDETEVDGCYYELNHTALTATFKKPKDRNATKVTIPDRISAYGRKYAVTAIADEACREMPALKSVTIGSKVENIGKKAFYECKKIKNMYIKTAKLSAKRVGEKAFAGIPASATYKCPASKLAVYRGLLVDRGAAVKRKFIMK